MDTVTVKLEPPEYTEPNSSPLNLTSAASPTNHEHHNGDKSTEEENHVRSKYSDSRNFSCLLCDVVCSTRDLLRQHLKDYHASKHYSFSNIYSSSADALGQTPGYINYRYTCSVCCAKFKSFRTYLTHTMSHRSTGSLTQLDEARMAALVGAGKQYMHDYFESEEGFGAGFTCSECKTVFMQRDSYAMHMMMRAMNETCKTGDSSFNNNEHEQSKPHVKERSSVSDDSVAHYENGDSHGQRCLEDVTSNVDQDEYLKSVLDKVCSVDPTGVKPDRHTYVRGDEKLCSFCGSTFADQDSLAMHVMSDHADEMTSAVSGRSSSTALTLDAQHPSTQSYLSWMAAAAAAQPLSGLAYVCKYCNSTFMSRDSLAMHVLTHAHIEEKIAEYARFPRKRKSDTRSPENDAKVFRTQCPINDTKSSASSDVETSDIKMFCDKCNIKFYALSEYHWHIRRHHEQNMSLDNASRVTENEDSVGLSSTEKKEEVVNLSLSTSSPARGRRNSTPSCSKTSVTTHDLLPKRPVSVGVCYNSEIKTKAERSTGNPTHYQSNDETENKIKSSPSLETVLSNVRALSSNEQRIIYSVFGKDLSLKVPKSTDNGQKVFLNGSETELPTLGENNKSENQAQCSQSENDKNQLVSKNPEDDRNRRLSGAGKDAPMCRYCEIVFFNKAIYYLHMGLHNVNNPWQCNVCGKICSDAVDFAAHVIHM